MKTLVVVLLGIIAVIAIVLMILWEILELAVGGILLLVAVLIVIWLYNKVKSKLD